MEEIYCWQICLKKNVKEAFQREGKSINQKLKSA